MSTPMNALADAADSMLGAADEHNDVENNVDVSHEGTGDPTPEPGASRYARMLMDARACSSE